MSTEKAFPELLTTKQLAELIGVSPITLANERYLKRGFPYIKIGNRVRYRKDDVIATLEANVVHTDGRIA